MPPHKHKPQPSDTDPDEARVLLPEYTYDVLTIPVTQALTDAWIYHMRMRTLVRDQYLAPTSCSVHRRSIRVWLRYLATVARTDAPDTATVIAFRSWIARFRRPNTVNSLLESVRFLYRWSAEQKRWPAIGDGVENLVVNQEGPAVPALTDSEFTTMLQTIAGDTLGAHRDRALLTMLRSCAVDTIALVRANVGAIDWVFESAHLVPRWRLSQWKRGDESQVMQSFPLTPTAQLYIKAYLHARGHPGFAEPLFTSVKTGQRMSALSMRLVVLRTLVAAGMRAPATGIERHERMFRYPHVSLDDLARMDMRIPEDTPDRERLCAIVSLLAVPHAMIPIDRVCVNEFNDDYSELRRPARGCVRHDRKIHIPEPVRVGIRPWLTMLRANPGSRWLFPGASGDRISHHVLKRLAWSVFQDQLPSVLPQLISASSRRMRPAARLGASSAA